MPRAKKEIIIQVRTSLPEYKSVFQERVNTVFIDSVSCQLKKIVAGKNRKMKILDRVIEKI